MHLRKSFVGLLFRIQTSDLKERRRFRLGLGYPHLEEFPGEYLVSGFPFVSVGDVLSHYRIVRKLGHGAYSTVPMAR